MPTIRNARWSEHNAICKIARQSKYTKDFSNMIFSSEQCYQERRIRVLTIRTAIIGFYCVRNRKRDGVTVLYFVGVDEERWGHGLGRLLMLDLHKRSTGTVELKVIKENPAVRLYQRLGYEIVGEAYKGAAHVMQWSHPNQGGSGETTTSRKTKK